MTYFDIIVIIKDEIAIHGYTQKEIAEKLGIDKSSLCNYLNFRRHMPFNLIVKTLSLFNISIKLTRI